MWNFLFGYFFARATGITRFVRPLLLLVIVGIVIASVIYTAVFLKAAAERNEASHVRTHHSP